MNTEFDWAGLSESSFDAGALIEAFFSEMDKGLAGEESSLEMLNAYLRVEKGFETNRSVIFIDAGGTNLRVGSAQFDDAGALQLNGFEKGRMLGLDGRLTKSEFFEALADRIMPVINDSDAIGFCFSYPCEILPNFDGELIVWSKGIDAPEVVGSHLGEELNLVLESRGIPRKKIILLNDTVATLLAGVSQGSARGAKGYVGFILGTGTNTAYLEDGRIINVESGGFNKLQCAAIDRELDAGTNNVGEHIFEKMISGTYLGPLILIALRKTALSDSGTQAVAELETLELVHLSNFAAESGQDIGPLDDSRFTAADLSAIRAIYAAVITRSALMSAANMAVAVLRNGVSPVCINLDGSTYFKAFGLREQAEAELKRILNAEAVDYFCVHVEDAPIVGTAIAALSI